MRKRPGIGAIAVTTKADQVLLVQRRNPPDALLWAFPGGGIEWGETARAAAIRELKEETGIAANPGPILSHLEVISPDEDGGIGFHFILVAVSCTYVSGTPMADDDALNAAWVDIADVFADALPLSSNVGKVLRAHLDLTNSK